MTEYTSNIMEKDVRAYNIIKGCVEKVDICKNDRFAILQQHSTHTVLAHICLDEVILGS